MKDLSFLRQDVCIYVLLNLQNESLIQIWNVIQILNGPLVLLKLEW